MVSNRLKADARAYMARHPGIGYQEALRAVTGDVAATTRSAQRSHPDLLRVLGIGDIDTHDFAATWEANAGADVLRFPIGCRRDGDRTLPEPVWLNLGEEPRGGDGSHTMVVDRAGSGKSCLLRMIVLALAATYGPDTVSFVLADGRSTPTFDGLDRLPHTAEALLHDGGSACDPAPRLVALIDSEMRRREEFLAEKNCRDAARYRRRRKDHHGDPGWPPLPDLLVAVDEFNPLVWQRRDVLDFFTRITSTGRTLGVHLLISSQRGDPAALAAIDDNIGMRIALRVSRREDSLPILGTDAATRINEPGIGLCKRGASAEPVEFAAFDHKAPYPRGEADGATATVTEALIGALAKHSARRVLDWRGADSAVCRFVAGR